MTTMTTKTKFHASYVGGCGDAATYSISFADGGTGHLTMNQKTGIVVRTAFTPAVGEALVKAIKAAGFAWEIDSSFDEKKSYDYIIDSGVSSGGWNTAAEALQAALDSGQARRGSVIEIADNLGQLVSRRRVTR